MPLPAISANLASLFLAFAINAMTMELIRYMPTPIPEMGGCVSTSGQSTCSSHSNGEMVSSSCFRMKTRRRRRSRTFADVASMQALSSIPNRIFTNGKGQTSCVFTQQGRKGINQDAMIVWEEFMEGEVTFCGIFDGHGPYGHLVSGRVRDALPLMLLSFLNQMKQDGSGATCSNEDPNLDDGESEKDGLFEDKMAELWKEAFLKTYKAMDKELKSHPNLDCFCSGSTGVNIVKQGSNLFMGNIGDSRAIMGSKDANDSLVAIQLTVDLKPDLPREAERITRCRGRVFALQDEPEVHRVWLPFDDAPGLAMARAFGDFCLKEYGVISTPEFTHRTLTDKDQFIVLASDGVWDVLSNEEVVKIVSSAPSRSSAARILVESASREWNLKYPTSKMDDCAVVCLFLDGKMDSESDNDEQTASFETVQEHSGTAMESDGGQDSEPSFHRNFTVRATMGENDEATGNGEPPKDEDQTWCGLEGVTRVNSIVQLPRFSDERPRPPSS